MRTPNKIKQIHFITFSLILVGCIATLPVKEQTPIPFYPCEESIFWEALKLAESGGNPKTRYVESTGEVSGGLYQVSVGDSGRYGCKFRSEKDLYDPAKNTDCKDKIAAGLRAKYPTEPWDVSLARYWGALRSKGNPRWAEYFVRYPKHNGYVNFQKYAARRGCLIQ